MHSTSQIIRFVLIMTSVVALVLSFMNTGLKATHEKNEATYKKRAILSAISNKLDGKLADISDDQIADIFTNQIKQVAIKHDGSAVSADDIVAAGYKGGMAVDVDTGKEKKKAEVDQILPVYVFTAGDGNKYYIVSVRGKGLWDEIWGNIALEKDLNTIAGVAFDHKAETPGLGAEIKDNADFFNQFAGKKIYDDSGFRSVYVRKGGAKDATYEVDGISGATITADGVTEMLARGLQYYEPYFKSIKG